MNNECFNVYKDFVEKNFSDFVFRPDYFRSRLNKSTNFENLFKKEVDNFFEILFSDEYVRYPLKQEVLLTHSCLSVLFDDCALFICEYINCHEYQDFIYFVYCCFKRYISNFNMSFGDFYALLFQKVKLFVYNDGRVVYPDFKPAQHFTDYSEHLGKNINNINYFNRNEFFVCAEAQVYNDEKNKLNSLSCNYEPLWVAKDYGDVFGFDILSYDLESGREMAIEVKSGTSTDTRLTPNEEYRLWKAKVNGNFDYYVFEYLYMWRRLNPIRRKFDFEKGLFVNIENGNEYILKELKIKKITKSLTY